MDIENIKEFLRQRAFQEKDIDSQPDIAGRFEEMPKELQELVLREQAKRAGLTSLGGHAATEQDDLERGQKRDIAMAHEIINDEQPEKFLKLKDFLKRK